MFSTWESAIAHQLAACLPLCASLAWYSAHSQGRRLGPEAGPRARHAHRHDLCDASASPRCSNHSPSTEFISHGRTADQPKPSQAKRGNTHIRRPGGKILVANLHDTDGVAGRKAVRERGRKRRDARKGRGGARAGHDYGRGRALGAGRAGRSVLFSSCVLSWVGGRWRTGWRWLGGRSAELSECGELCVVVLRKCRGVGSMGKGKTRKRREEDVEEVGVWIYEGRRL